MAPFFDDRGHLTDEGVAMYVDALKLDRTRSLPESIRAHVSGCQACRVNITGLYSLIAEEPVASSRQAPGRRPGVWRMPHALYRIAAVLVAGIGFLLWYFGRTERPVQVSEQEKVVRQATDSGAFPPAARKEHAASAEIASNFTPYAELEGLVGSEVRGESFEVLSPGEAAGRTRITFAWRTTGAGPWKLVLVDNRGGIVREAEVQSTPFVVDGAFRPGLYYWKVIRNDELEHVGKFRVE